MIKYPHIKCNKCGKNCYPMDMHSKNQCKVCWLKEYKKETPYRMTNYRKNKLLSG